ncbi:hypothetical protein V6N13_147561 [Hibiscus sabdariffa]|uniref:Uncharacterized protein n=1 Tax=Hibiscus sabdariffa TaxID=183260 RepID=A0ABR2TWC7_9ROSI
MDPSDLRKQKGIVEEAFAKHEERYTEDKERGDLELSYSATSEDIHEDNSAADDGSIGSSSLVERKRSVHEEGPRPKRMRNLFKFIMARPEKKR